MIRCVRLWSGAEGARFEEGVIDLEPGARGDVLSDKFPITSASFHETDADPKLGWHRDPARQLVITLTGALEFATRDGRFVLRPGDILFTEDTTGAGHDWTMVGDQPWRRLYVPLDSDTVVPFRSASPHAGTSAPQKLAGEYSQNDASGPMIRCVRLWTGDDQNSHFEHGHIDLGPGQRGDMLSGSMAAATISFRETASGGAFAWHTAPARQLVITLSGILDFQTQDGEHFLLHPGEILFAEDAAGTGHKWRLTDDQPWRRAYVVLQPGAAVPFIASKPQPAS